VRTTLGAEHSTALGERPPADLGPTSIGGRAPRIWVHENLPAKNALAIADAEFIEAVLRQKLATIEVASATPRQSQPAPSERSDSPVEKPFLSSTENTTAATIVRPGIAGARRRRVAAKTVGLRKKEHCTFIATQRCIVCGRTPSEAITFAALNRALGRKVSDE
jgi:hypothetical protein